MKSKKSKKGGKPATAGSTSEVKRSLPQPRLSNAERSAYFARREAAKVLRTVLQGDAQRRAVASVKSLVYGPSVRNKRATLALVCQTLKYLPVIKNVVQTSGVINSKWKREEELMHIIAYDILFGQEMPPYGTAEKFLLLRKDALQLALAKIMVKRKVKRVEDLLAHSQAPDSKPRYVRVNTLKIDVETAINEFEKHHKVQKDDMVSDLLILPPGTDLHDHPLVENGSVFLQGKASSMVAAALAPQPGWEVLDACSAPGNKTVHLAALMKGKGKITACELNGDRVERLKRTVSIAGATNVEILHGDFLSIDVNDPAYLKLRAILLDPSCSGSGTVAVRLDHLLPSFTEGQASEAEKQRLSNLAAFQKRALEHALSFPSVERIVYSTCSIHQVENEYVVQAVLPLASSYGFELATPFPQWPRRGFPVFDGANNLLRTDPHEDKEGFFIALFVRTPKFQSTEITKKSKGRIPKRRLEPLLSLRMSKSMLYSAFL